MPRQRPIYWAFYVSVRRELDSGREQKSLKRDICNSKPESSVHNAGVSKHRYVDIESPTAQSASE